MRLNESVNNVKQKYTDLVKNNSIGKRLIEAFGTSDKAFIAEKLGFSSVQAVYKVINGDRELDFEKLQNFRNYTKRSIDWLLTGEEPIAVKREFDIESSINRNPNWLDVMSEWYEFEGEKMPDTMGASFMGGWQSFDMEQKVSALRDFKRFLDLIKDEDDDE